MSTGTEYTVSSTAHSNDNWIDHLPGSLATMVNRGKNTADPPKVSRIIDKAFMVELLMMKSMLDSTSPSLLYKEREKEMRRRVSGLRWDLTKTLYSRDMSVQSRT